MESDDETVLDLRARLDETEREVSAERDARWANHAALADLRATLAAVRDAAGVRRD